MKQNNWFEEWFNSDYYHILYEYRDESEAERFINNLVEYLPVKEGDSIIDVGCGQGRHSISLSNKGFNVTGIDLSENNINLARKNCLGKAKFDVCDMRTAFKPAHYKVVLNLFTSFGYFENANDDLRSLEAMGKNLVDGGILVLDYFNATKLKGDLNAVESNHVVKGTTTFGTTKYIENGYVIKDIKVEDKGKKYEFKEKVKLIDLNTFRKYLNATNFRLLDIFGDYELNPFEETKSDRLILVAEVI